MEENNYISPDNAIDEIEDIHNFDDIDNDTEYLQSEYQKLKKDMEVNVELLDKSDSEDVEDIEAIEGIHNNIDDCTLEPGESVDIIEKFLQIYNTKHGSNGSMFENVDVKNPADTNDKMEMFYEYMMIHRLLQKENSDYVDVYGPDDTIDGCDENEVFALVVGKEAQIKYISLSYISLLTIGVRNSKDIGKDWSVVSL